MLWDLGGCLTLFCVSISSSAELAVKEADSIAAVSDWSQLVGREVMPSEANYFSLALLQPGTLRPRKDSQCLETLNELEP